MRLIKTKPTRPFPVADRTRDGDLYRDYNPRLRAVAHLRELLADGRLGVDAYDTTIVIVEAREHERVWTGRACELTGLTLGSHIQPDGGHRFRVILEVDVRQELGLDRADAPVMDEPLASRRLIEEGERLLADPRTPVLRAVADARDAQTRMLEREVQ